MTSARTMLLIVAVAATIPGSGDALAQEPADLLPAAVITGPAELVDQTGPVELPETFAISFDGSDPDGATGQPVRYRYLVAPALLSDGTYADTRLSVEQSVMDLAAFARESWSEWLAWEAGPENRQIIIENLPAEDLQGRLIHYVAVLQVMDEMSAVSVDRAYGSNLAHFFVEVQPSR